MSSRAVGMTVFVVMTVIGTVSTWSGWRTGRVQGYCEAKYGPSVEVVWTGALGITGECELAPAVPARRVVAP